MSVMAQGLVVENARAQREQVAATSIDIIKCFERVPHRVIQRVGLQLGFPPGPLKFVISLYRGVRRLLCDNAVSSDLVAPAGIVAGCAYAAFLLRAVMEQPIKTTAMAHPTVSIFVFLDDVDLLAAEAGPAAATTRASAARRASGLQRNEHAPRAYTGVRARGLPSFALRQCPSEVVWPQTSRQVLSTQQDTPNSHLQACAGLRAGAGVN